MNLQLIKRYGEFYPEDIGTLLVEADLRDQIAQFKSQFEDKERIIKLMEDRQ